jgi:hypothetical protein
LSVSTSDPAQAQRRANFQAAVAAMGEPARTVLTADDADSLLHETGWQPSASRPERARRAGFVVAEPA